MSTHPYIPLYVDDYDAATTHLTVEEDGVYSRLIRLCWRTPGCSLPNDPAWIARKIRMSAEDFSRIGQAVLDEFFSLQRGRLIQRRLKREYDDISRKKSARKLAGKKGGTAKAQKTKDKPASIASDLLPDTGAYQTHTQNHKDTSVPDGTGEAGSPLGLVDDLAEERAQPVAKGSWRLALRVLTERGKLAEPKARALVGKWASAGLTHEDIWAIAEDAWKAGTLDPVPYLAKAAEQRLAITRLPAAIDAPTERQQTAWMQDWREHGAAGWKRHTRGPYPGEPGCRVSEDIQRRFDVKPDGHSGADLPPILRRIAG